jgi:hypothetical protein
VVSREASLRWLHTWDWSEEGVCWFFDELLHLVTFPREVGVLGRRGHSEAGVNKGLQIRVYRVVNGQSMPRCIPQLLGIVSVVG